MQIYAKLVAMQHLQSPNLSLYCACTLINNPPIINTGQAQIKMASWRQLETLVMPKNRFKSSLKYKYFYSEAQFFSCGCQFVRTASYILIL